jgi:very-short-patch-repair endonuclease
MLANGLKAVDDEDTAELSSSMKFVNDAFPSDRPVSSGIVLVQANEVERISWLKERARDAKASLEWREYLDAGAELEHNGLAVLRDEVLSGAISPREALPAFRARFRKRWLDEAYRNEPLLREFDPGVHEDVAERFRELDRFWIHNGFTRIRPRLLEQCPKTARLGPTAPNTSEIGVLLRETNKKRRHLPLRKLFAAMPTLLQRLKPCIMMSPLSVSTYFDSCDIRFDLVIFDEASQVRPHDAICAIYRGNQLVVAGDQKQLPPTNFFERLSAEESETGDEEDASTNDFESILDTCAALGLPRQRLKWHYRSRRESLISFSNRNFYGGELITFPSVLDVDGSSGVTFNFIADARRGKSGSVTNAIEATRIAESVVRHATLCPEKSLGIITMNVGQQILVMDEVARLRQNDSKIAGFFAASNPEPFFVKNLENVQGDERDVIFIGIGFAKPQVGALNHNFGPLNRSGGERRLNVAVTRARESLCVFSSIKAQDIDLSRTSAVGAALLQAYLDFAERGPIALVGANTEIAGAENDSEFEAEVERALRAQGLDVRRQVGCCGYRIDLAIVDPSRKGRYVLGIEADGATYHSSASARDRDRLRQELLESLGWRITRIWSTDWIRNPQRQIERVLKAYTSALANAAVGDETMLLREAPLVQTMPPTGATNDSLNVSSGTSSTRYNAIDDVPFPKIEQSLHECLRDFGSTSVEDLLQYVARSLGFSRTGARIRERIHQSLTEMERLGSIRMANDRVTLSEAALKGKSDGDNELF